MLAAFVRLSRLKFLAGGVLGVVLGTVLAAYGGNALDVRAAAVALGAVLALQLMTHYANDFFDRQADALTARTPFSGGSGTLIDGSIAPAAAMAAALVCAAGGLTGAAALGWLGKPLAGGVLVVIAVLAWAYSAPPLRLLARGLGEADTAAIVGLLVPLCGYLAQAGDPNARSVLSTLAATGAMFVMMLAVEYPDAEADGMARKRNLVVRAGPEHAASLVRFGFVAVVAAFVATVASGGPPALLPFAALAVLPMIGLERALRRGAWRSHEGRAEIAARGVTLFIVTSLGTVLGYLVAL